MFFFAVTFNPGAPFTSFGVKSNPLKGAKIIRFAPVGIVLTAGSNTQILPSIIKAIEVDVINLAWPISGHPEPCESVSTIPVASDAYHDVMFFAASGDVPSGIFTTDNCDSSSPREDARFGIIVEDTADEIGGKIVAFGSHIEGIAQHQGSIN